jgi:polyisoprenoid-binding protein YceI
MRKLFGTLALAAFVAVFGCSGADSTAPTGRSTAPASDSSGKSSPKEQSSKGPTDQGGKAPTDQGGKSPATSAGAITPDNTKIEFVGAAPDHKHDGGFKKFSGSVKPVDGDITKATIKVEIDTTSIWTDDDGKSNKLTAHLKSPDFFDTAKYPTATFVSKEIKKDDANYVISGDLTLHGVTKPVSMPAKVTTTDDSVTIDGTFTINRPDFDFGKTFNASKLKNEVTVKVVAKVSRK